MAWHGGPELATRVWVIETDAEIGIETDAEIGIDKARVERMTAFLSDPREERGLRSSTSRPTRNSANSVAGRSISSVKHYRVIV